MIVYRESRTHITPLGAEAVVFPATYDGRFRESNSRLMRRAHILWPAQVQQAVEIANSRQSRWGQLVVITLGFVQPRNLIFAFTRNNCCDTDWLFQIEPAIVNLRSAVDEFEWDTVIWPGIGYEQGDPNQKSRWPLVSNSLSLHLDTAKSKILVYEPRTFNNYDPKPLLA